MILGGIIKVPDTQFNQDFLNCEVAKKLAVKGSRLYECIKHEYKSERSKHTLLFNDNILYICDRIGNDVVLVAVN